MTCLLTPLSQRSPERRSKMNEMVGDDTALAAILSGAIYSKSVKYVATGCDLLDLR